ncbi:LytR/AlgR family response regulator transcription factor [Bacillus cereus]|uniref:LytR/AlgR family response regulator transcription factor n=1 Tax=Bacillus cereus TaxID=1396 RepID=UPI000BF79DAD|nr:LytTR family DNA-binding domain-containing protein [Bacillus cereus]PFO82704.1 DNA-binding response regulator [Bacillus cereus]
MKILLIMKEEENRHQLIETFTENIRNVECFEAETGMKSLQAAKKYTPDFIFLDTQLQDGTGFEFSSLLQQLSSDTKFIFIGDNIEEAIMAFRFQAFYYLLRPFRTEDLQFLLHRIEQEKGKSTKNHLRKLSIESHEGITYLSPEDIVYVSKNKENKTVSIYTTNNQYISTYTLQELENKLTAYDFLRVHKSYLINTMYVQELKPYYNGTYNLYLERYNEQPIPVSRNYVKRLRNKIEL